MIYQRKRPTGHTVTVETTSKPQAVGYVTVETPTDTQPIPQYVTVETDTAGDTTWEDFESITVGEFNAEYSGGNPIWSEDDDAVMYFTTVGIPHNGGYVVTVVQQDGEWWSEATDGEATGIAQSDGHETPEAAWEDTKRQLCAEEEGEDMETTETKTQLSIYEVRTKDGGVGLQFGDGPIHMGYDASDLARLLEQIFIGSYNEPSLIDADLHDLAHMYLDEATAQERFEEIRGIGEEI